MTVAVVGLPRPVPRDAARDAGVPTGAVARESLVKATWSAVVRFVSGHAPSILLLAPALALVAIVHTRGMSDYPMRFDDEGTYVSQAWSLLDRGELAPYTYWYDHPPFGWMQLAAYFGLTGALGRSDTAILAGREAMVLAHLASCVLLFVLCRRLRMGRPWALLAVGVYTFSPLALSFHRMVLLDNIAMPWVLAAFVLALTPQHRLSAYTGSAVCFAAAVHTKQTMAIFLPALLYQVWQNTDASNRRYAWTMFASALALALSLYPLYALLKGELLPGDDHVSMVDAMRFQMTRQATDSSSTIDEWLHRDRLAIVLGLAAMVPAAFVRHLRPYVVMGAACVAVVLRPGYLPIPFVVAVFLPAAVLVAGVFEALARWRPSPGLLRFGPAALAVVGAAGMAAWVGPHWRSGDESAMRVDQDEPMRDAQQWVEDHVPPGERLLVDNAIWTDLVRSGIPEEQVVWFYKVDLDPIGVGADLEGGFRDFGYIVSTQTMRDTAATLPNISDALDHSVVVATFGTGFDRVEVRQIHPDDHDPRDTSARSFVVDLYEQMLGRDPSPGELTRWLTVLHRHELDRDGVVQSIADSPEHLERIGATE